MWKYWLLLINTCFCAVSLGQVGGQRSYEFVNIPYTPRTVGLGGLNVSTPGEDVNLVISNPALSTDTLSGLVSFNYLSYFADAHSLATVYQHDFGKWGSWFIGVNHLNYGTFDGFDPTGAPLGEFDARETYVTLGRAHRIANFSMGGSIKFIQSNIAGFNSSAVALDIGGAFMHPTQQLSVGLVFKNIGFVISDYSGTDEGELPFDIQAGVTFKPRYMPFRFTFTGYNLSREDIAFFDPVNAPAGEEEPGTLDKLLRRFTVGTELILSKNFNLRAGYNHLVRQELKLEDTAQGAGFSFGLMFRVKAFEFAYSRGGYHAAGGSNNFSLTANTNMFLKRRTL